MELAVSLRACWRTSSCCRRVGSRSRASSCFTSRRRCTRLRITCMSSVSHSTARAGRQAAAPAPPSSAISSLGSRHSRSHKRPACLFEAPYEEAYSSCKSCTKARDSSEDACLGQDGQVLGRLGQRGDAAVLGALHGGEADVVLLDDGGVQRVEVQQQHDAGVQPLLRLQDQPARILRLALPASWQAQIDRITTTCNQTLGIIVSLAG